MIYLGNVENAIEKYYALCSTSGNGQIEKISTKTDSFEVKNVNFIPNLKLNSNQSLKIELEYFSKKIHKNINVNVGMFYGAGLAFHVNNHTFDKIINIPKGKGKLLIDIKNISFNYITVYLAISIWTAENEEILFWWRNIPIIFSKKAKSRGENHFVTEFKIVK
jgi:hypothetical protein